MSGKLSLYLSMAAVRSGSSLSTVSPSVQVASRPGMLFRVLIGIRVRIDSRTSNSDGNSMRGSCRGRKPLVVETMKAGSDMSSGFVSLRTSKCGEGVRDPILAANGVVLDRRELGCQEVRFGEEEKTKYFEEICEFSRIYLLVGEAGIKSGLGTL